MGVSVRACAFASLAVSYWNSERACACIPERVQEFKRELKRELKSSREFKRERELKREREFKRERERVQERD
jgi:hypothetical protein